MNGYSTSFFSAWSLFLALGWVESVPLQLHGCFPPRGPVITARGLTQPFLPLPASSSWKSSRWQAQPSWAQGERVGSPLLLGTPLRSAWEDEGNCRKDQAGASSPRSHLPRHLGPWEAGEIMRTRNPGAGLGAEGHKGRAVIILRKFKSSERRQGPSRSLSSTPSHPPGSLLHPSLSSACGALWPEPTPGFFLNCFLFPSSPGHWPSLALPSSLFIPLQRTLTRQRQGFESSVPLELPQLLP